MFYSNNKIKEKTESQTVTNMKPKAVMLIVTK